MQVPLAHVPHAPQLLLQHTPSVQKPLAHCALPVQLLPLPCGAMHAPSTHTSPLMQSVSCAHWPRHASLPQTRGVHACVMLGQVPLPSHEASLVATPPVHEATRQLAGALAYTHA